MATLRPFCGVRPAEAFSSSIAALPYDVYDRIQARAAVQGNPLSFLRIDRAETQFPPDTDMYSSPVYERARDTLSEMFHDGQFVRDENPCYYIYSLTMQGRTQNGLVGCASIDDYLDNVIRKHENTLPAKELDRIRHIDTMSAHTGPIFLTCRPVSKLRELIAAQKTLPSLYDFTSEDSIRHQVWKIDSPEVIQKLEQITSAIDRFYIADGHHRAASAVKVGLKRREEFPNYTGKEEFNYFLSVLFASDELQILPYNRIVRPQEKLCPACLLATLKSSFEIEELGAADKVSCVPRHKGEILMYLDSVWYRLNVHPDLYLGNVVSDLDVSVLQRIILEPLFHIRDPKTDSQLSFIGGISGQDVLPRLTEEIPDGIAFSMYPTSMEELLEVADAGELMPPKSTWFEPKLRSGLFIHEIET